MKTVFITHNLSENSVFKRQLENEGLKVSGKSLIDFSAVSFEKIPEADWIFFYSKNGVFFFFQTIEQLGLQIPNNVKWATIGPQTAKALASKYREPDFIGNGDSKQTAEVFLKMAKGQKILFPQAKNSLRAIQNILKNKIITIDFVVYNNEPKKDAVIPPSDFLVFTSPMNAEVYFEKMQLQPNQKLFAIGQSTSSMLIDLGITTFEIAEIPSEEGLAKIIIKNLKSDG